MSNRLYIDIKLPDQKNLGVKLITQVMSNLHRLFKHHSITDVSVGFPQFGHLNPYGSETLGQTVRLVSENRDHLELIKGNVTFKTLVSVGVLEFAPITKVPDQVEEVRFYKDSKPIKAMRRLKEASETEGKKSYRDIDRSSIMVLIERQDGSKYPIFVAKTNASKHLGGAFNSYGFTKQDGPTFPIF